MHYKRRQMVFNLIKCLKLTETAIIGHDSDGDLTITRRDFGFNAIEEIQKVMKKLPFVTCALIKATEDNNVILTIF